MKSILPESGTDVGPGESHFWVQTECASHDVSIYIAGPLADIERACQVYCEQGLCVTVSPTEFIYTYGRESGARVGLINYARFPLDAQALEDHAHALAVTLMRKLSQRSCSVVTPDRSYFVTRKGAEKVVK